MIRIPLPLFCFLLFLCSTISAQNIAHRPGEFLVSLPEGLTPESLAQRMGSGARFDKVAKLLNIWRLQSDLPEQEALAWLKRQPEVRHAQFNHLLENRSSEPEIPVKQAVPADGILPNLLSELPDDPLFDVQWHHINEGLFGGVFDADMDSEQAWEFTTGGLSPAGDTIVLAVIDGGLDANHEDLAANLWFNRQEIPGNGQDDDQNGYIDDFRGWNVFSENDQIAGNSTAHGTPVSAILGAKGNNGIGVTGVNWHTKIMFVAASGTESEILSAYDYVLQTRQRYNDSWGAKGAFVVAVNCSWGIDYGQPADAPLWCEAFDILGAAGVVSVAATANLPINVDEQGDLPTACPSNFLISVTNLNRLDFKAVNAAWGFQHVDLGAYGQEVFTASAGNGYSSFNGTSFAAPQVAGAIGLLYAAPCPNLIALAKTDPSAAAYWAKSLILENVTPNPSLAEKTLTEGRLNLFKTLATYESQCSDCPAPFALKTEALSDTSVNLLWTPPPSALSVNLRWRTLGVGNWMQLDSVGDEFSLHNLATCTDYEFSMQSVCEAGLVSAWSQPLTFQTTGCCVAPTAILLDSMGLDWAIIRWEPSSFNNTYRLRIRKEGTTSWVLHEANFSGWLLEGLASCTNYEVQVQARCEDWFTAFSPILSFKTKGCGACNELEYCNGKAEDATEEWIASVQLGAWLQVSGAGGNGYQNFCLGQSLLPSLIAEEPILLVITPGFPGGISKEYFRVFIDYNQDGDFEDANELAFDPGFAFEGTAEGWIVPPLGLIPGITRIRVMMKFTTPNDDPPASCDFFDFGQVEDYCAELLMDSMVSSVTSEESEDAIKCYPQPAHGWALLEINRGISTEAIAVQVRDMTGRIVFSDNAATALQGRLNLDTSRWPAGLYAVQVRIGTQMLRTKLIKA